MANQGRKGKEDDAGEGEGRPKKRPRPQRGGRAKEARERLAGHVPSPNFAYIAEDPLKAHVVAIAIQRLYSPSELSRDADIPISTATATFKALRKKGILELVKEVPVGGAVKHMHRATEAAFVGEGDWEQMADALRAVFSGTIIHDFNLRATQALETGRLVSRDDICLYWAPRDLDEIAWREQAEVIAWCIEESLRMAEDTARRRANGESEGSFHSTFAVAAFPSPTYDEFKAHLEEASKRKAAQPKNREGQSKGKTTSRKGKRAKESRKRNVTKGKSSGKSTRKGKAKRRGKGTGDKT